MNRTPTREYGYAVKVYTPGQMKSRLQTSSYQKTLNTQSMSMM